MSVWIIHKIGEDKDFKASMLTPEVPKKVDLTSKSKFGVTYKIDESGNGKKKYSFIKFNVHPQAKEFTLKADEMTGHVEAVQMINGAKEIVNGKENFYDEKEIGNVLGQLGDYIVTIGKLCH